MSEVVSLPHVPDSVGDQVIKSVDEVLIFRKICRSRFPQPFGHWLKVSLQCLLELGIRSTGHYNRNQLPKQVLHVSASNDHESDSEDIALVFHSLSLCGGVPRPLLVSSISGELTSTRICFIRRRPGYARAAPSPSTQVAGKPTTRGKTP